MMDDGDCMLRGSRWLVMLKQKVAINIPEFGHNKCIVIWMNKVHGFISNVMKKKQADEKEHQISG